MKDFLFRKISVRTKSNESLLSQSLNLFWRWWLAAATIAGWDLEDPGAMLGLKKDLGFNKSVPVWVMHNQNG